MTWVPGLTCEPCIPKSTLDVRQTWIQVLTTPLRYLQHATPLRVFWLLHQKQWWHVLSIQERLKNQNMQSPQTQHWHRGRPSQPVSWSPTSSHLTQPCWASFLSFYRILVGWSSLKENAVFLNSFPLASGGENGKGFVWEFQAGSLKGDTLWEGRKEIKTVNFCPWTFFCMEHTLLEAKSRPLTP